MNPFLNTDDTTQDLIRKLIRSLHAGRAYLLEPYDRLSFTNPMLNVSITNKLGKTREVFLPILQDHIFVKIEAYETSGDLTIPQLRGQIVEVMVPHSTKLHSMIRLHNYPELMEDYIILRDALYHKIK